MNFFNIINAIDLFLAMHLENSNQSFSFKCSTQFNAQSDIMIIEFEYVILFDLLHSVLVHSIVNNKYILQTICLLNKYGYIGISRNLSTKVFLISILVRSLNYIYSCNAASVSQQLICCRIYLNNSRLIAEPNN